MGVGQPQESPNPTWNSEAPLDLLGCGLKRNHPEPSHPTIDIYPPEGEKIVVGGLEGKPSGNSPF